MFLFWPRCLWYIEFLPNGCSIELLRLFILKPCARVHMCTCAHVYMCRCVHVHMCTVYGQMSTGVCVYTRPGVYVRMCTRLHVYMCTCEHAYMGACVRVYVCTCAPLYRCGGGHAYACTSAHVYMRACGRVYVQAYMCGNCFISTCNGRSMLKKSSWRLWCPEIPTEEGPRPEPSNPVAEDTKHAFR